MGLVDGGGVAGLGYWQIIKPLAATNLVANPSFEKDTTGWSASSATIFRITSHGQFGAHSGRLRATAVNGATWFAFQSVGATTQVCISAYVQADSPLVQFQLWNNAGTLVATMNHPGDGLSHRLELTAFTIDASTHKIAAVDTRSSSWSDVYIDGVQAELGDFSTTFSATTYCDGDQDGCTWDGAPHASTSTRDGRDGRGGQLVSFDSLGLGVTAMKGGGAPEMDVSTQTLALGDGELYQRSTAKARTLTLETLIQFGTAGLASTHATRRTIVDLFRPDGRSNRGPIMLRYAGAVTPKRLQVYYQSGLEMDTLDAATEKPPIKLIAPQPDWQAEVDESSALTASTNLTVGKIAFRDRTGVWSGLGGGTALPDAANGVQAVGRLPDGRIVAAGYFTDMGGVGSADFVAVWDGSTWSALGGLTIAGGIGVQCMCVAQNGDVYIGGNFADAAGIANADRIAKWTYATNTWSALSTGANGFVNGIAEDTATGFIWFVGQFTTIGGVSSNFAAYWNGSTFVATTGLTASGGPIVVGPDGRMYTTATAGLYVCNGTVWSLLAACNSTDLIFSLFAANGLLYVGGGFTTIGGVAANRIASWNGTSWSPLGSGVSSGAVWKVGASRNRTVYAAGVNWASVGGIVPPDNIAQWNGSSWAPLMANPPDTGTHTNDQYFVTVLPDDSLVVWWISSAGTFATTMTVPGRTTVTNSGSAVEYPVITIDTTGQIYGLLNRTTGQSIALNGLNGAVYGTITMDLRPGRKTIYGSAGASLLSSVLPGSDLATFCLAPGSNVIELYVSGTTTATLRAQPRFWSAD